MEWGGGGGGGGMSSMDLVAFSCGRLCPRGGDRLRRMARLLRAAETRPKISRSEAGGQAAGRGGLLCKGGALRCKKCPWRVNLKMGTRRRRPGVVSGGLRG